MIFIAIADVTCSDDTMIWSCGDWIFVHVFVQANGIPR